VTTRVYFLSGLRYEREMRRGPAPISPGSWDAILNYRTMGKRYWHPRPFHRQLLCETSKKCEELGFVGENPAMLSHHPL